MLKLSLNLIMVHTTLTIVLITLLLLFKAKAVVAVKRSFTMLKLIYESEGLLFQDANYESYRVGKLDAKGRE